MESRITRQAVEWLEALKEAGPRERKAFVAWVARSPEHVQEFLTITAIDRYLDHVPADYPVDRARAAKVAQLESSLPRLHPVERVMKKSGLRFTLSHILAAAATLAAVVIGGWWAGTNGGQRYTTDIGEQRAVELAEGSVIHLNADSAVRVRFSASAREIHLLRGEALFKVKRDPARPFRVHADETVIQAIGTQFNVYRRESETTVAVLEGTVEVRHAENPASKRLITTGQEIVAPSTPLPANSGQKIFTVRQIDPAQAAAWRQRRLIFEETSLPEIVAEFNRYQRRPQLRVEGEAAAQRRFTGVFDADDPESLVQLLDKDRELLLTKNENEVIIKAR